MFKEKYEMLSEFNRGNYGVAYKVRNKQDAVIYIAKTIPLANFTETQRKKAMLQLQIMKELQHPHIVSLKDSFVEKDELIIVLEFCELGDLSQHIRQRRQNGEHFSENLILNWLLQLVMALDYIHKKKILHRDIKSANVFITASCVIKLGDFGISKILSETVHSKTFIGTPYYMSPEMCMNSGYTSKSDIWSLGCVLFEMCTLDYPFKGKNLMELLQIITTKEPQKDIPTFYSEGLRKIIKKLLVKDPHRRPTASQILFDSLMVDVIRKAMSNSSLSLKKELEQKISLKQPRQQKVDAKVIESHEAKIMKRIKELQRMAKEKLQQAKCGEGEHSLTLYQNQLKSKLDNLQKVVEDGFKRLRAGESAEKTLKKTINQQTTKSITTKSVNFGEESVTGSTIQSIVMGETAKIKKQDLADKTIQSVNMQSKVQIDQTINSMLLDTIGQLEGTLGQSQQKVVLQASFSKKSKSSEETSVCNLPMESNQFGKSTKFVGSSLMKTIQSLRDKTEQQKQQLQKSLQNLDELQQKLGDVQIFMTEVRDNPAALLDQTLLTLTLSMDKADKLKNALQMKLNKPIEDNTLKTLHLTLNETMKPRSTSPFEQPLTNSIHFRDEQQDYANEQFEQYEEEEEQKPTKQKAIQKAASAKQLRDREQRQKVAEIYRSLLTELQKPQRNKYLNMSQIKEVSDEGSTINSGSSSKLSTGTNFGPKK